MILSRFGDLVAAFAEDGIVIEAIEDGELRSADQLFKTLADFGRRFGVLAAIDQVDGAV